MPYIAHEQRILEVTPDGQNLINGIALEIKGLLITGDHRKGRLVRTVVAGLINGVYGGLRIVPYESINKETEKLTTLTKLLITNIKSIRTQHSAGANGLLNYTITRLLNEIYPSPRYHDYNEIAGLLTGLIIRTDTEDDEVLGILDCCKSEYYRKYCAPYEELKESENGVVSRPIGESTVY